MSKVLFTEEVNDFLKKLHQEVKRIRKINNNQERKNEAWKTMKQARSQWDIKIKDAYYQCGGFDKLSFWQEINLGFAGLTGEKYEGLDTPWLLLERIFRESQSSSARNPSLPRQKPKNKPNETAAYTCSNCSQTKSGYYYINPEEQDDNKFCSEACFDNYYSPLCDNCSQKCLDKIYYQDRKNKEGNLCSNCNEKRQEEFKNALGQLEKELFKKPLVLPEELGYKDIDDLIDLLKSVQDYGNLEDYLQELITSINQIRQINSNTNNNNQDQREREREQIQLQRDISDLAAKPNRTAEEEAELANKRKALEELDNNPPSSAKEPRNWKPWVIGGLVLVSCLALSLYFY